MPEGRLLVCGTPIGNLGDVSDRLKEALSTADVVYAEDTRRTAKLLAHLGCEVSLQSLFAGNEKSRSAELAEAVAAGKTVVLVSDAGMPVVSDPGAEAVRIVREAGHTVSVIPGPSAVTTALAISGLAGDRFVFDGFLPRKGRARSERIATMVAESRPVVLFASPHRLAGDLEELRAVLGGTRQVVVTRELTKLYEEVWSGSLDEAVEHWSGEVKGELTLVVAPAARSEPSLDDAIETARAYVSEGQSVSDAARRAAMEHGVSRREVYQTLLGDQDWS